MQPNARLAIMGHALALSENTLGTAPKGNHLARFRESGCFDNLASQRFLALSGARHTPGEKLRLVWAAAA
jgi:hypothetical protein